MNREARQEGKVTSEDADKAMMRSLWRPAVPPAPAVVGAKSKPWLLRVGSCIMVRDLERVLVRAGARVPSRETFTQERVQYHARAARCGEA